MSLLKHLTADVRDRFGSVGKKSTEGIEFHWQAKVEHLAI